MRADGCDAYGGEFDAFVADGVAVAALVAVMERFGDRALVAVERHRQVERLPGVTQVEFRHNADLFVRYVLQAQRRARFFAQRGGDVARAGKRCRIERRDERPRIRRADVGGEQAERAEQAGVARHDDAPHAEIIGQRAGVQRAAAAERHQHEVARIEPALDRHDAQHLRHVGIDERDDARGRTFNVAVQRCRNGRDRRVRARRIDRKRAADQRRPG